MKTFLCAAMLLLAACATPFHALSPEEQSKAAAAAGWFPPIPKGQPPPVPQIMPGPKPLSEIRAMSADQFKEWLHVRSSPTPSDAAPLPDIGSRLEFKSEAGKSLPEILLVRSPKYDAKLRLCELEATQLHYQVEPGGGAEGAVDDPIIKPISLRGYVRYRLASRAVDCNSTAPFEQSIRGTSAEVVANGLRALRQAQASVGRAGSSRVPIKCVDLTPSSSQKCARPGLILKPVAPSHVRSVFSAFWIEDDRWPRGPGVRADHFGTPWNAAWLIRFRDPADPGSRLLYEVKLKGIWRPSAVEILICQAEDPHVYWCPAPVRGP